MKLRILNCAIAAVALLLSGFVPGTSHAQTATSLIWSDVSPDAIPPAGDRVIVPQRSRTVTLDLEVLREYLANVPLENTPAAAARAIFEMPLPEGGFGRFAVVESPCMAPELQARYPDIRTYAGYGIDDASATTRFDLTLQGFHAIIFSTAGTIYIDPYQLGDLSHYQSYFKRDFLSDKSLGGCTVLDDDGMQEQIHQVVERGVLLSGGTLRTYRLALAATGEYTTYQGGTIPLALSAMTTSMNRVNGCYEKDLAIHMTMVPNEDLIIYTNAATDPYTNNNGGAMLTQNQSNLDSVIGTNNYDIGHVFSTGGGGIAGLGVVCRASQKARGVTGSPAPHNDGFDIDYVAHEIGHQFGSNHCFNGTYGSCSGGNRNGPTAYEPGSASTIMGYAGICAGDNLQPHSDDYFVWISIQEIVAYSQTSYGNNCPNRTPTGVIEPVVSAGAGGFTIPISTPLQITGSATTTGTPTYCWEESDLGPAGHPGTPSGNAPIFRTFDPVASPTRIFPKVSDLVTNHYTIGELLPTYARTLSFRLTVRDTQAGGVGVTYSSPVVYTVTAAAGPFLVTSPNTAVTWGGSTNQTVIWDVAGTNVAPVNCSTVNILLSTDGGYTFPTVLLAGAPNTGSATVLLPPEGTTTARIKVEAAANIFFDISNINFTITDAADVAEQRVSAGGLTLLGARPNPFVPQTAIGFQNPRSESVTLKVYDLTGRHVRTLVEGRLPAGWHNATWDGKDAAGKSVGSGVYLYKLSSGSETLSGRMTLVR